ncbi:carboxypeptidase-like regulatory domain-containing protein [Algibacter sp. L4_22]|uniref:Kelch repeat-containing protein n=1 Tax=Algibacter sp. L4_22 TaxID=2942477 RepID=UPI00201B5389|nr:carboxypeptidase-like regulatory domain-containing protein [Algibacter sp. L4_22]MCL5129004.1 carboxypeptidase-like regulatory domain-containing protein [Algibacter sp. L4_22]
MLILLSTYSLFGQNMQGTIVDSDTNAPLENVTVYFKKIKKGTNTNTKGEFILKLDSKLNASDTIFISMIGYHSKTTTSSELKKTDFKIRILKKTEQLNKIVVSSNQKLKTYISYKKLAPLKRGIHSFGSELIDNKIYLIAGDASYIEDNQKKALLEMQMRAQATFSDLLRRISSSPNPTYETYKGELQVYDLKTNSWKRKELKFKKRAYHNINYFNNNIYVLGGKGLSANKKKEYLNNIIEIYDIKNDSIIIDKTNPHQAINFASFSYNNNLIVMGGSVKMNKRGEKIYTDKSHIYNVDTGYWYELKNMTKAKEVKGVLIENIIYLIGGFNGKPLTEIETYNITTGTWTTEGDLFSGLKNPALAYSNNMIYIFEKSKLLTYNIITKTLNEYNINLKLEASRIHYYKNKLYVVGGYIINDYSKSPSSNLYSIDINEFETTKIINSKIFSQNLISN